MPSVRPNAWLVCTLLVGACGQSVSNGEAAGFDTTGDGGADTGDAEDPVSACYTAQISAPPSALVEAYGLDPFYRQHLDARGIPVVASELPAPQSLRVACEIAVVMMAERPEVVAALQQDRVRIGVMSQTEVTTDMPEHADLDEVYPQTDWDTRARGLGATRDRPLSSVGEENLLHLPGDVYAGESIMVHEFAHTLFDVGIVDIPGESGAGLELVALHQAAVEAGTWSNTYAATNTQEYWAEAVQSWFDANLEASPADGVHGPIDTRTELRAADPAMAEFIGRYLIDDDWSVP